MLRRIDLETVSMGRRQAHLAIYALNGLLLFGNHLL